jgi:Reverse transcriptase (RNA-dependent DNA polymerase)
MILGQDFTFTFAPVAQWDSIRMILCLAAIFDHELHIVDIKTAYLNGNLDEEVYLRKPEIAGPGY